MMTFCSILFVLFWMTIHTGSFFIAGMGMCQMLMTLFVSFFFYRFVFQITFFAQMQVLAIFLVLGVGADDIFVLTDAWKQSKIDVVRSAEENEETYLKRRMLYAYKRAAAAIFNTSFTTAMAFVSTGINPIMSISCFGWYASICIGVLYLLTITWIPSVILVQHRYFRGRVCCPCLKC